MLLRNLRETTRLLFLLEVTTNRHSRLRTIAEQLDMTVQGASEYAHGLEEDGLLAIVDGEYRGTRKGIEFLHDRFVALRSFVDRAGRAMALVETTSAMAHGAIRRGDRVGLFMEGGLLVAYANRESPSHGIAANDAGKGDVVAVRDLEGIVELRPGHIVIARTRGGRRREISPSDAKRVLRKTRGFVVAANDPDGLAIARQLGLRPRIEFGLVRATVDAAERGVDVLLIVPEERAAEAIQAIEAANAKLEEKIPYETIALG